MGLGLVAFEFGALKIALSFYLSRRMTGKSHEGKTTLTEQSEVQE